MPASLHENLKGLDTVKDTLKSHGIDMEYLARKLKEELEAEGVKRHFDGGRFGSGEFKKSESFPLYDIRQKARMDAQKLLGAYPNDQVDIGFEQSVQDWLMKIDGKDRDTLPSQEDDD